MVMMRKFLVVVAVTLAGLTATTPASAARFDGPLGKKYLRLYAKVKAKHGDRAPGRNIVKHGVRFKWKSDDGKRSHWGVRDARRSEVRESAARLRAWAFPAAQLLSAANPSPPPSNVATPRVVGGHLAAIRACESGGNYGAVSSTGKYRGAYQFDYGTWASVGGTGDPAAASPAEQDKRAAILYSQRGAAPWPICGR
jgi:hypothetical protein